MRTFDNDLSRIPSFVEEDREGRLEPLAIVARARQLQAEELARLMRLAAAKIANLVREWLVAPVMRVYLRGRLYDEMTAMDQRILADIGVNRHDIPGIVDRAYPRWILTRRAFSAVAGFVSRGLVAPIMRLYQRQKLASALTGLDDRILADIGIERYDIPRVVSQAYAERLTSEPAGLSQHQAAAEKADALVAAPAAHGQTANDPAPADLRHLAA